jgi:hypothetical protein
VATGTLLSRDINHLDTRDIIASYVPTLIWWPLMPSQPGPGEAENVSSRGACAAAELVSGPSPNDTIESLEAKLATAQHAHAAGWRSLDQLGVVREELRVAIAYKRGACLCTHQRHVSCQRQRSWCLVKDCACDTCRVKSTEASV